MSELDPRVLQVFRLYQAGKGYAEIGRTVGIDKKTVADWLERHQDHPDIPRCCLCHQLVIDKASRGRHDKAVCAWCEQDMVRRGRKRCRKCGVVKPREAFAKQSDRGDGLHAHCRICKSVLTPEQKARKRERDRQYASKHADHRRQYQREYRANDRDVIVAYQKTDRARAKQAAASRRWHARHPDYRKNYYHANRERIAEKDRVRNRAYRIRKKLDVLRGFSDRKSTERKEQ